MVYQASGVNFVIVLDSSNKPLIQASDPLSSYSTAILFSGIKYKVSYPKIISLA